MASHRSFLLTFTGPAAMPNFSNPDPVAWTISVTSGWTLIKLCARSNDFRPAVDFGLDCEFTTCAAAAIDRVGHGLIISGQHG